MKLDILAIAAHPDDVELSCSGTLIKHQKNGYKTGVLNLTLGELGTRGSVDIRKKEAENAAEILKLSTLDIINLGDGTFENNEKSRLEIIKYIRKYQPEIVLINAPSDRHPDHGRAAKLAKDACFYSGLVKIQTEFEAWRPKTVYHYIQDYYHEPDFVIDVSDEFETKMKSMLAYKSQFYNPDNDENNTPISSKEFVEFIEARAIQYGRSIGVKYGEGFVRTRTLGVKNFFDLH